MFDGLRSKSSIWMFVCGLRRECTLYIVQHSNLTKASGQILNSKTEEALFSLERSAEAVAIENELKSLEEAEKKKS